MQDLSNTVVVLLSFEGPDAYSSAGGLSTRVTALSRSLAGMGVETHLFFVGDPSLPAYQTEESGSLHLHRWCQWISAYHPLGVYDGEEGKVNDWDASLPAWLCDNLLQPAMLAGKTVTVLGEEWQTARTITALRRMSAECGLDNVRFFWNANNTFGFHRIDWPSLRSAATLTTVSRFMRHTLEQYDIDPIVIPNGIAPSWLEPPSAPAVESLSSLFNNRLSVIKVGRWDPNKRWLTAVDAVADLKQRGQRPLFIVRGGMEQHGQEVLARMRQRGLRITNVHLGSDAQSLTGALAKGRDGDVVLLESPLKQSQLQVLYNAADVTLANSGFEPFGLVGLEAMASGGVVFVGATGEDYATPGVNAVSLHTDRSDEIVGQLLQMRRQPELAATMRREGRQTARRYTWPEVIARHFAVPMLSALKRAPRTQSITNHRPSTMRWWNVPRPLVGTQGMPVLGSAAV